MKSSVIKPFVQHHTLFALILSALLLTSLVLAACAPQSSSDNMANMPTAGSASTGNASPDVVKTEKGQYTNITVAQLQTMLKNKDFLFVNVHIPFEGSIAGTDKFIPFDTIDQHLDQLPADKNAKIVLYCRSDHMSNIAARTLSNLGYTNLYQLVGGFNAWKAAGLPLGTTQK